VPPPDTVLAGQSLQSRINMLKFQRASLLLVLVLSLAHGTNASETSDRVDKLFETWDKPASPGATLAVIKDGQIVYSRGYGLASLEYGVRNSAETVFHVASLSKQFTAFAIHLLVQEGRISLDDDIRKYVPEMKIRSTIKIRHLLHHTSGLRDQWSLLTLAGLRLDDVITEGDILGLLFDQRDLNFLPGEEELYSNSGYTLLALIVQRVAGQPFAQFAEQRIFLPLGMSNTRVQETYGTVVPGRAYSYFKGPTGYSYVALSYSNSGATSVFTTVGDLARWDWNLQTGKVSGQAVSKAMRELDRLNGGGDNNYASGLVLGRYRGLPTEEHNGADAGYRAELLRFPEQRLTVAILANASDVGATSLAYRIADMYLEGTPGLAPAPIGPTPIDLNVPGSASYLGDYQLRPGFLLSFTSEGHQLMVQATGQSKFVMDASADNAFFTRAFVASVVFDPPGADGLTRTATWKQRGQSSPLVRVARGQPADTELRACTGDFFSDELHAIYTLSVRDGALWLRYPRGSLALTPLTRGVFSAPFPIGTVIVQRNAAGQCESLAVTTGRVRNLAFRRVGLGPAP
jgi:CubicO group peptidase (beta-lactamase class C family)